MPLSDSANQIADAQLDKIAPSQFAVDAKVKQGAIAQPLVLVEVEPNGPNVAWS